MKELVLALLTWITANGPYDMPASTPQIEFVPAAFFASARCADTAHCGTRAYYLRESRTILLHDVYRQTEHPRARAILVHELVHYLQDINNLPSASNCNEWVEREHEANRLQLQYLVAETGNYHLHLPVPDRKQCEQVFEAAGQR